MLTNKTILIIEDDPRWADRFQDMLSSDGCRTFVVSSFPAAVEFLSGTKCDLIVLDLYIEQPSLNQIVVERLADLRRLAPNIPIIAATGKARHVIVTNLDGQCTVEVHYKLNLDPYRFTERVEAV